jgi:hypothetical protein
MEDKIMLYSFEYSLQELWDMTKPKNSFMIKDIEHFFHVYIGCLYWDLSVLLISPFIQWVVDSLRG